MEILLGVGFIVLGTVMIEKIAERSICMYIRIVGDSNTAVLKDKPFSVTASLSTQSTQVSRWIPCNVYYYVKVETGITAPGGLEVNGGISAAGASCVLTWTASTVTGAKGSVTYLIFKNGAEAARTTDTTYTFSQTDISGWENAVLTVKGYNADAGTSGESNSRKAAAQRMGYTNSSLLKTEDYADYLTQKVLSAHESGEITEAEGEYILNHAAEQETERKTGTRRGR